MSNVKSLCNLVVGRKYYIIDKEKDVLTKDIFDNKIKFMLVDILEQPNPYINKYIKLYRFLSDNGEFVFKKDDSKVLFIE